MMAMVFFLTRSALCIGIVAIAASGVGTDRLATTIDRGARDGLDGAARACLGSSDCLRVGTAALSAVTGEGSNDHERAALPSNEPARHGTGLRRPEARQFRKTSVAGG